MCLIEILVLTINKKITTKLENYMKVRSSVLYQADQFQYRSIQTDQFNYRSIQTDQFKQISNISH